MESLGVWVIVGIPMVQPFRVMKVTDRKRSGRCRMALIGVTPEGKHTMAAAYAEYARFTTKEYALRALEELQHEWDVCRHQVDLEKVKINATKTTSHYRMDTIAAIWGFPCKN